MSNGRLVYWLVGLLASINLAFAGWTVTQIIEGINDRSRVKQAQAAIEANLRNIGEDIDEIKQLLRDSPPKVGRR